MAMPPSRRSGIRCAATIPISVVFVALVGFWLLRTGGWDPYSREMWTAAMVSFAAAELSVTPLLLFGGNDPATTAQAGLAGLVVLLLSTVMLAAAATVLGLTTRREPFVGWLLVFSWFSLVIFSWNAVVAIKKNRSDAPPG